MRGSYSGRLQSEEDVSGRIQRNIQTHVFFTKSNFKTFGEIYITETTQFSGKYAR